MGTNLPSDRGPAIDWITEHIAQWTANAASIGVAPADVAAVAGQTSSAVTARSAAGTARQASKDATLDYYDKAKDAMDGARDLILQIKSYAVSTGDPQVYVLAGISPRDEPGETPAPESPSAITATLLPGGPLLLKWKCRGPSGTFYIVHRKLSGESAYSMIATVTDKAFTDNNLPKGVDEVFYQINAQHRDKLTLGDIKLVQLGAGNNQQGQQASGQTGGQGAA